MRLIQAGSDHVILSALYPEGGRVLARLYQYQGQEGPATIGLAKHSAQLEAVDLLGRPMRPVTRSLAFGRWQIQTVRLREAPTRMASALQWLRSATRRQCGLPFTAWALGGILGA